MAASPCAGHLRNCEFTLCVTATQPVEAKVTIDSNTCDCLVTLFGSKEARSELGLIVFKKGRVLGKLKPLMTLPVAKEMKISLHEEDFELWWKENLCCKVHTRNPVLSDLLTSRINQMNRYQQDPFGPGSCSHKWIWYYADLFPKAVEEFGGSQVQTKVETLMPEHYDSEIMDTYIRQHLKQREVEFTQLQNLTIFAGTWNCGGTAPREKLRRWLAPKEMERSPDLIVVALQETCKLQAASTLLGDPERSQLWRGFLEEEVTSAYPKDQYATIETFSLVGLLLIIMGKMQLLPHIPREETDTCVVKCGLKGSTGNKGAVGGRFRVFDTTICIVSSHLSARTENIQERNAQFHRIASKLHFHGKGGKSVKLYEHDVIIWLGDLNYRISRLSFEEILGNVKDKNLEPLLQCDQLRLEMQKKCAFVEFQEGQITFPPTYKFRQDHNSYDNSGEHRREPAWCDRILWRGQLLQTLYYYCPSVKQSDHRPVLALFQLSAKIWSAEACRKVKDEILRQIDSAHQKCLPQIKLSSTEVVFPDLGYKQGKCRDVVVTNVCPGVVKFRFKEQPNGKVTPSWLFLNLMEGIIAAEGSVIWI